jgi:hypothetical protein
LSGKGEVRLTSAIVGPKQAAAPLQAAEHGKGRREIKLVQKRRASDQEVDFLGVPRIGGRIRIFVPRSILQVAKVL